MGGYVNYIVGPAVITPVLPVGSLYTLTIGPGLATANIQINDASGNGVAGVAFLASNVHFNFTVGVRITQSEGFEITPSTASGGNTFSTPRFTVSPLSNTHSTQIADATGTTRFNAGFLESPINNQATPYTAVLADSGKTLYYNGTGAASFTIPANASVAYPVGTILTFINDATGATNMTIAITTDTMVLSPGGTTGSRTLAQFGKAVAEKLTATRWIISGSGLT